MPEIDALTCIWSFWKLNGELLIGLLKLLHLLRHTSWLLYSEFALVFFCREGDSFDMRKKLPFCVGLLLRLLKKNHRVFVTCTTGFDRSPASVIAYLHWMTDTSLHAAYNFVTRLHSCRPARFFLLTLFARRYFTLAMQRSIGSWSLYVDFKDS